MRPQVVSTELGRASTAAIHRKDEIITAWTSGYVADIGYTFGYYPELNPLHAQMAFGHQGLAFPQIRTACELGFGQGLSANLHACASAVAWWGTDFNPSQAGFAREFAAASGSGAQLFDASFAEFCARDDLPLFDTIGLHGIWSWISDQNRAVIVDFVRRKLAVGGILYISYNTFPGWAAFSPMRHLMVEHAEVLGAEGRGIVSRIDGAIEFAEKLLATQPLFGRANPQVGERLRKMKEHSRHYLAHEYFNRDWDPMHLSTLATWLEPAKLQFACSATMLDLIDPINLSDEQQTFLAEIPDPMFRQSVRDFMVNQQFRRDYWVKGLRKLSPLEQGEALRKQRLILVSHRSDIQLKVNGALGEARLNDDAYLPVLDLLADHVPRTLGELEEALRAGSRPSLGFSQLLQVVLVLHGAGHLMAVQRTGDAAGARTTAARANAWLLNHARGRGEVSYLASPLTGGGISVGRFQQLFLLARMQGAEEPRHWAREAWTILARQGQRLMKEGKALENPENNLKELEALADTFAQRLLPILEALEVSSRGHA